MISRAINKISVFLLLAIFTMAPAAQAITLDWSGYFRADHTFMHNYQMNMAAPGYSNAFYGGEYIKGEGKKTTTISSMFMKLKPKALVNDNIIVRSEWNIGDPVAGFFGRGIPREDRNNPLSTGKDSMSITMARLWLDTHTDFGTLQVGRAPMHWGNGVIFDSGDDANDRYQSTSDTIRLVSKFGYLSLMPLYAKNSFGRNAAGSQNVNTGGVLVGSDDVTDYGLGLKYDNPEEDLEGGALFYKRNANDAQTSYYYPGGSATYTSGTAAGMNLKLIDFYIKKSWTRFEIGAEIPIYSGSIGDVNGVNSRNDYKATAITAEGALKFDTWRHSFKLGTVPGQAPTTSGAANRGKTFSAMYLHRNYKLGHIMFGYNLGGFGGANPDSVPAGTSPTTSVSPYDAAITNAKYLMLSTEKKWEQWSMSLGFVYAQANQTALTGKDAYNHRTRTWFTSVSDQSKDMGYEVDFGTKYNWDDNVTFSGDIGVFFPGKYFKYVNSATFSQNVDRVTSLSISASTSF